VRNKYSKLRGVIPVIGPGIGYIELTRGLYSIVDSSSLEVLSGISWYAQRGGHRKFYASRHVLTKNRMHHVLLNVPDGMVVDHINGDSLDNRLCNLRLCTQADNMRNLRRKMLPISGIRGVYWSKRQQKYQSSIKIAGKPVHLGTNSDPYVLSAIYEAKRIEVRNV
jgi:hypothetical protein